MKLSKRNYYNQYFLQNSNNSKKIWKGIKQIIHYKPKSSQTSIKIVQYNKEVTDPKQIANTFNKYFANIGNELAKSIPTVSQTPFEYLKTPTCNSFALFPAIREEI